MLLSTLMAEFNNRKTDIEILILGSETVTIYESKKYHFSADESGIILREAKEGQPVANGKIIFFPTSSVLMIRSRA